jgi:primase-polymerase (primpol)-like protein
MSNVATNTNPQAAPQLAQVVRVTLPNEEGLPPELKEGRLFVAWDEAKCPWMSSRIKAKPDDPETWLYYEEAVDVAMSNGRGVGRMIVAPDVGIDLDLAIDKDGNILPWAQAILDEFAPHTYIEYSPSRRGFHVLGKGEYKAPRHKFLVPASEGGIAEIVVDPVTGKERKKQSQVEIYTGGRYFTLTGDRYGTTTSVAKCQDAIDNLTRKVTLWLPAQKKKAGGAPAPTLKEGRAPTPTLEDDAIIAKVKANPDDAKLWNGDMGPYAYDESKADLALCTAIARYTDDLERVDRIFRASGLYWGKDGKHLTKWERGGAYPYGDETVRKAIENSKANREAALTLDEWIEEINRSHFYCPMGGKARVIRIESDGRLTPLNLEAFRTTYGNRSFTTTRADGRKVDRKVGNAWLDSPHRREYLGGVGLYPDGQCPPDVYNLWRGFAFEPQPGDWSLFRAHLGENLCQGRQDLIDYLLDWMAYAVQFPHRCPEVAVVIRGKQGTGKTFFADHFGRIFGSHYLLVDRNHQLTSNFNKDMEGRVLIVGDEAFFAGDKAAANVLKGMVTSKQVRIEQKGVDAYMVPSYLHLIIIGNADWLVHTTSDDRRFFVADMPDVHMRDSAYFGAIERQLAQGGYAAMLHDLLKRDLSDINLRVIPETEAKADQRLESLEVIQRWWANVLDSGELQREEGTGGVEWGVVSKGALYADYVAEGKLHRGYRPMLRPQFWQAMRKMVPSLKDTQPRRGDRRERAVQLPPLEECRTHFSRLVKIPLRWSDAGDEWA